MRFYRVEHPETGRGPYKMSGEPSGWDILEEHGWDKHHLNPRGAAGVVAMEPYHHCACESLSALQVWFARKLESLCIRGFEVVTGEAELVWYAKDGFNQIGIDRRTIRNKTVVPWEIVLGLEEAA